MYWPPLCRERLNRILWLLACNPQGLSVREFARTYNVWKWEVEQAAALGCLTIEIRKPRTGRPARIAVVSKIQPRNLPPMPWYAPKPIRCHYRWFACDSTGTEPYTKGWIASRVGCRLTPAVNAYQGIFPGARSRAGARASASRLMRHPDVKAARMWSFASYCGETPLGEPMPDTAHGIYQRLLELGSPRVTVRLSHDATNPADAKSLFAKCVGGSPPAL